MPIGQNFMISPPENSRIASAYYTIGVVTRGIGIGSYVTLSTGVDVYWFSRCWCAVQDTLLPNGSHVLLTGLANGSVLYEALRNRVYPLGRLHKDIYYPDFYNFLTCIGVCYYLYLFACWFVFVLTVLQFILQELCDLNFLKWSICVLSSTLILLLMQL